MTSRNHRSSTSSLPPRKRLRSPSPQTSPSSSPHAGTTAKRRRTDLTVEICHDYTRNSCRRSEIECKFAHPHTAVSVDDGKVTACVDGLRGKCFRGSTCRYYHPPPHIKGTLLKAIGVEEQEGEQVCRDFVRGKCSRAAHECRFAHHVSVEDCAVVCQDFLRGRCERKSCRYAHDPVYAAPQVHLLPYGALPTFPGPPSRTDMEVCKDFLMNRCHRDECKYYHPHSQPEVHLLRYGDGMSLLTPPQTGYDKEVCKDFLMNKCHRNECKYAHPRSQPEVRLLQYGDVMSLPSPPRIKNDKEVVPVCQDFLKKRCHRDNCKYAHLGSRTEVHLLRYGAAGSRSPLRRTGNGMISSPLRRTGNGMISSPLRRTGNDKEVIQVCKDFLKKRCDRDKCKYAHPGSHTEVVDSCVEICRDFNRGDCLRSTCRFYHPRKQS